jgi:hypothetical protein
LARCPARDHNVEISPRRHDRPAEYNRVGARFPRRRGRSPHRDQPPLSQHLLLSLQPACSALARNSFKRIRWTTNLCSTGLPTLRVPDGLHAGRNPATVELQRVPPQVFAHVGHGLSLSHRLPVRDYLAVIVLFVNGVKSTSAPQISRDLAISTARALFRRESFRIQYDAILRAAVRKQVGSVVRRLHRQRAIESISAGRASKCKLASA